MSSIFKFLVDQKMTQDLLLEPFSSFRCFLNQKYRNLKKNKYIKSIGLFICCLLTLFIVVKSENNQRSRVEASKKQFSSFFSGNWTMRMRTSSDENENENYEHYWLWLMSWKFLCHWTNYSRKVSVTENFHQEVIIDSSQKIA